MGLPRILSERLFNIFIANPGSDIHVKLAINKQMTLLKGGIIFLL